MWVKQQDRLQDALCAMACASSHGSMAGHAPAAIMAAYYFVKENAVNDQVAAGVTVLCQRMLKGEHLFGEMINQRPWSTGTASTDELIQLLSETMTPLKGSGHNTIYAGFILRALEECPASQEIVDDICELLETFRDANAGWAHVPEQKELANPRSFLDESDFSLAPYQHVDDMFSTICTYVVPEHFNRAGVGGSVHLIDHAVAIYDLQQLGYSDLVKLGLQAHHEHLCLWMALPTFTEEQRPRKKPSPVLPTEDVYWQQDIQGGGGGLEHRLKILYGAYRFRQALPSVAMREQFEKTMPYLF